jgi:glutamate transport system substrate-binding protein
MLHVRARRLAGAAVIVALALTGCARTNLAEPDPIPNGYGLIAAGRLPAAAQKIKDRGELVVGIKTDAPGFGFDRGDGEVTGFDAEIARLMAIRIFGQPKVRFVRAASADREKLLTERKVDLVLATYTITAQRAKVVGFVGPYFIAGQDILVRADNQVVDDLNDLRGKRICTQQGSTSLTRLKAAATGSRIFAGASYAECAKGVAEGRYDAVTTDDVILAGLVAESGGTLRLVGSRFSEEPYGVGVARDDTELQRFVASVLSEIFVNGDWSRAWLRSLSNFLGTPPQPPELTVVGTLPA